ncbi:hypothetical protein [Allomuricauda sp. d1]|uniref:hypothetical protein n=1 Tax=Allomuricauda sp. d1 TaxID=3136725 RepID=UPI0031D99B51
MKALLTTLFLLPLMLMAQNTACKCCTDTHKAFDFWVGSWVVTNADGSPAGNNTIVKEEGGCVLRENWTSASAGFTGTSLNFYNQQSNQWEQLWIDNSGNHLKLKGNRTGDQMILSSDEFTHTDGESYINRITWTHNQDGTVNQLWEVLQNNEVKQVLFNGLYRRDQ